MPELQEWQDGWVEADYLRQEVFKFREKWHLNNKELCIIWNLPYPTLSGIITVGKKRYVKPETAKKILDGIKNYDPRTCDYRRFTKEEAAKVFKQMKEKHRLSWTELAQITGAHRNVFWDMVTPTSQRKYVPISEMRRYLKRYQEWDLNRRRELLGA